MIDAFASAAGGRTSKEEEDKKEKFANDDDAKSVASGRSEAGKSDGGKSVGSAGTIPSAVMNMKTNMSPEELAKQRRADELAAKRKSYLLKVTEAINADRQDNMVRGSTDMTLPLFKKYENISKDGQLDGKQRWNWYRQPGMDAHREFSLRIRCPYCNQNFTAHGFKQDQVRDPNKSDPISSGTLPYIPDARPIKCTNCMALISGML